MFNTPTFVLQKIANFINSGAIATKQSNLCHFLTAKKVGDVDESDKIVFWGKPQDSNGPAFVFHSGIVSDDGDLIVGGRLGRLVSGKFFTGGGDLMDQIYSITIGQFKSQYQVQSETTTSSALGFTSSNNNQKIKPEEDDLPSEVEKDIRRAAKIMGDPQKSLTIR